MTKAEIENSLTEAENQKAELAQQLQEIEDRIAYLTNERKALAFSVKQGDKDATTRAKSIDTELGHLRKQQAATAEQVKESESMVEAIHADLRAAVIEEAQTDRDRKALAVVEGWLKLYELQQELQEVNTEIDRRTAEANGAENTLRGMVSKDYSTGPSFDPPLCEMPRRLAELNGRRNELFARLGIG